MAIAQFVDLMQNTTSVGLNTPNKLRSHLNRHGYGLPYMLKGAEGFKSLQGGKDIRFDNLMTEVSTYRTFRPGEKQTWSNPQVTNYGTTPWRFSMDEQNMNLVQILLQSNEMSGDRRATYFVEEQSKIEMRSTISMAHGLEDELWALPVEADMEAEAGTTPNSLNVFCNEMSDGLYTSYRTGSKNVLGINTDTYSVWDNQRSGYKSTGLLTGTAPHLFTAFDDILQDLSFSQIPGPDGAMFSDNAYGMKACFTQKAGVTNFMNSLRVNQDYFRVGAQDPAYPNPVFNGIPIIRVEKLETAPIYHTAHDVASGSETSYGAYDATTGGTNIFGGPRYHFIDFTCTQKAVHEARYFYKDKMKEPSNQVDVRIQPILIYHNNICQERRRQGIVYPTQDI
tara:strand:+ start:1937 stop:3121 length:1185 start_codon:yes stop_codon:yes gene_type:complete